MTTWDSVSSTKRFPSYDTRQSRWGVSQEVYNLCQDITRDDCQGQYGVHRFGGEYPSASVLRRHLEG
jgi:hypothetical protein